MARALPSRPRDSYEWIVDKLSRGRADLLVNLQSQKAKFVRLTQRVHITKSFYSPTKYLPRLAAEKKGSSDVLASAWRMQ
jgi:hypothetical protein